MVSLLRGFVRPRFRAPREVPLEHERPMIPRARRGLAGHQAPAARHRFGWSALPLAVDDPAACQVVR